MVQYVYDAWGKHTVSGTLASTVGVKNPFRYRGYYYDTETGLYYLQTRYYDPEVGRFLNMDSITYADSTTFDGLNLYAYCLNNPIYYIDDLGQIPIANYFNKTYVEKTIFGFKDKWIGRIDYSITTLEHQSDETGIFYAYNAFNSLDFKSSAGVGINLWGWLGADISVDSEINLNFSVNVTPWVHAGVSVGLNGISVSAGVTINETSHDFTIGIGLAPLIIIGGIISIVVSGGQTAPSFINWLKNLF